MAPKPVSFETQPPLEPEPTPYSDTWLDRCRILRFAESRSHAERNTLRAAEGPPVSAASRDWHASVVT